MRKPDNITYWLDERPPLPVALPLALQQMSFLAVYLVVSPLFARILHLDHHQTLQLISATMLASSLGVLLQAMRRWGIGSGLFCPMQATSSTFGALTIAKAVGGIEAMFGAIGVLALTQLAFSWLLERMRAIFTIQVAGVSVMLIGLGLGHGGLRLILESNPESTLTEEEALLCLITLGTMIACNVWSNGYLRLFSAFIGLAAGVLASWYLGAIPTSEWEMVREARWFYLPELMHHGWRFDYQSIFPAALTGLFLAFHGFGAIIAAQRFNDANWKRPDLRQVRQGVVAEGLTNAIGSLFNAIPVTGSGGAVSLAAATGCTSRYLAYWLAAILALLAFMPKVILFWDILPSAVMGSAMIFLACFTAMAGLQIIASRLLDNRKILIVGIGLLLGISYESLKDSLTDAAPEVLRVLLFSGVGLGVLVAVALAALFRIGDHTRRRRAFDIHHSSLDEVMEFLERQGKSWGARGEVVHRAEYATWQAFEILTEHDIVMPRADSVGQVELETIFDEFHFTVVLRYQGAPVPLVMRPPTAEEMIQHDHAVLQMAGYMLRRLADRVSIRSTDTGCELELVFRG